MKKQLISLIGLATSLILMTEVASATVLPQQGQPPIIPQPVSVQSLNGQWYLNANTYIVAHSDTVINLASYLADKIRTSTGYACPIISQSKNNAQVIRLSIVGRQVIPQSEGYRLEIKANDGVTIEASTIRGLFYGIQSFLQILPADIESPTIIRRTWSIPCYKIIDYPRFGYRGMMFDVCRHFMPIEKLKAYVDILAMLKINVFHWHLTEDQGWRIEIKKYPKLTEIGSKRLEGDGSTYGPYFYTQDQIRDFVAYAASRQIEVIPEIEMPGHALAALASYPELGCKGKGYSVRNIWGISDDVYCAGNDQVFKFIDDVISEVAPLFPSKYIHIGGDECPKTRWKECPKCQKRIKDNGLKDEYELQSYFVTRAEKILEKYGKRLIGWDEILEGGLAPSATVMSWTGEKGGIHSANMGHDVIMTPSSHGLYLDHYQGDSKVEPQAICCYAPLRRIYAYDPIPAEISPDKRHHILGAQANLWTEYITTPEYFEYMFLPRIAALSELDWTPLENKNYDRFLSCLGNFQKRLDYHQLNYFIPQPEQPNGSLNTVAFIDTVTLTFKTVYPVKMLYTLDGSEPTEQSAVYHNPLLFYGSATLKIRSQAPNGKMSPTRTIHVVKQVPVPSCSLLIDTSKLVNGLLYQLVPQGQFTTSDALFDYIKWMPNRVKTGIVKKMQEIKQPLYKNNGNVNYYGGVYEGYINIAEDGVYVFSSLFHKVWLDGHLIISNEGELQHQARHDYSIALAAGLHQIKFTYIGQITGGFPTQWNEAQIYIKKYGDAKFNKLDDKALYTIVH